MSACPICGLDDQIETQLPRQDGSVIECRRCGKYMMEGFMVRSWRGKHAQGAHGSRFDPEDRKLLPYLSAYTRQTYESCNTAQLDSKNWRDFAREHSNTPEEQKTYKLLKSIHKMTSLPGESIHYDCEMDYPLLDAASATESYQILEKLKNYEQIRMIQYFGYNYLVTLMPTGRQFLEEKSSQVIGEMDYEAVPEASRQDLTKAADRYRGGDLSGALAAACAAVDSACARVYKEKGLGDPAKVPSFQQKVISSLRANRVFQRLESELIGIEWDSEDARRLAQNLEGSLNQAAYVMQTLRSKMSDAHGSKTVLEPVVFDSLKWAAIIAVQLR